MKLDKKKTIKIKEEDQNNIFKGKLFLNPLQISLASLLMDLGYETVLLAMEEKSPSSSSPAKGGWPTIIS